MFVFIDEGNINIFIEKILENASKNTDTSTNALINKFYHEKKRKKIIFSLTHRKSLGRVIQYKKNILYCVECNKYYEIFYYPYYNFETKKHSQECYNKLRTRILERVSEINKEYDDINDTNNPYKQLYPNLIETLSSLFKKN